MVIWMHWYDCLFYPGFTLESLIWSSDTHQYLSTHSIWENQPYLTWSKWNMDEIFGLKYHLSCAHMPFFILFFENPSMRRPCHFYYWICHFKHKPSTLWSISIKGTYINDVRFLGGLGGQAKWDKVGQGG